MMRCIPACRNTC